jgi:glycine/D-amino acid oxidase-like deaminating enzyme
MTQDFSPRNSLWRDTLEASQKLRPALTEDLSVDIAIIGAGYTGLWSAFHLIKQNPGLSIAIFERDCIGFGASGRNGGWASALYPISHDRLIRENGSEAALLVRKLWHESITHLEEFSTSEKADIDFYRGGTLTVARNKAQLKRMQKDFVSYASEGYELLNKSESISRIGISRTLGGMYTRDCARIHPLKLALSIADAVEKRGVKIFENTPVESYSTNELLTASGKVKAKTIIVATEAYSPQFKELKRSVVPLYSLLVATEPLPEVFWNEIGWKENETLAPASHLIVYAQRTADNRIAIGGRGAPYHYNSSIKDEYDNHAKVHESLRNLARGWFPALREYSFTHAWGGPLGITRDWHPSVSFDRKSGIARAGGYVGDGVTSAYIAGQTITSLILERDDEHLRLPWVNHRSPQWEPEPIRWASLHAGLSAASWADREEAITGVPSVIAKAIAPLLGS